MNQPKTEIIPENTATGGAEPEVTPALARELGLLPEEFDRINEILGRAPTFTELGIYSVMWSEHCSYKNSIAQIKTLPRGGSALLAKAGEENAGAVDIGDGLAVVFKIESHNHPSALEPYQGAATGVGGIHRDIFTMGARPLVSLNSLRFGSLENPRVRYLLDGVVRGIGDYGNCFGVPTLGGETSFDECYDGNPLVNAMSVGLVKTDGMISAAMEGPGNPVMIVGSKTGRDGIHGATFASVELSEKSESQRSSVQVGDPFTEKLLLEASLEIIKEKLIIGIQDMGAAGITCSCTEMSAKGGVGVRIDIDRVPVREPGMSAYEILLSESQERMLVCVRKGNEDRVKEVFDKWGLDSVIIGEVTNTGRFEVTRAGKIVADVPSQTLVLGGEAPVYLRDTRRPDYMDEAELFNLNSISDRQDWNNAALRMLSSPNLAHKGWVFGQYDQSVRGNTVVGPGSDAAVIRIKKTRKAVSVATDCNARYCYLDPHEGAKIAVAEAARNVVCSGGKPLAITNCLNFGNPYKPEVFYTFTHTISGMGEACRALDTPVTGGNVSFYNENPDGAVFPTPVIGMIGLIENLRDITTSWFKSEGDYVYLLGESKDDIGATEYLKVIHGQTTGHVPRLDLKTELRLQKTLLDAIRSGLVHSAHDISDGGLFTALAECCVGNRENQLGAELSVHGGRRTDALLFGETQSRVIISVTPAEHGRFEAKLSAAGQKFARIGLVGGARLKINSLIDLPLTAISDKYYNTLSELAERVV
ncbi:MAG: phosphoribosylformylglycinamidine synthase subunit PurL [Candidatus Zixiibacteriota bacterium]